MRSCDATILGQFDSRFVQVQAMFDRFNMIQHPNSTTSVADFFLGACWRCRTSAGPVCASYFWGLLCFSRQLMTQGGVLSNSEPHNIEHEWNQMNKDMTQRLLLGLARAVWPSCDSALGSPKWKAMDSAEESLWLCGCGLWMNPKQIEYNFCVFLDRVVFTFANACFHELNKFKALMIHKTTLISHTSRQCCRADTAAWWFLRAVYSCYFFAAGGDERQARQPTIHICTFSNFSIIIGSTSGIFRKHVYAAQCHGGSADEQKSQWARLNKCTVY